METWETIRLRCRRDGEKIKPVARELGSRRIRFGNIFGAMGSSSSWHIPTGAYGAAASNGDDGAKQQLPLRSGRCILIAKQ
jgi:hypothetical protein